MNFIKQSTPEIKKFQKLDGEFEMNPQLVDVVFKVQQQGTMTEARRCETEYSCSGNSIEREQPKGGLPDGSVVKNLPLMQEMRVQSMGQEDPLEKEMATYSSILAWKIPWTEEPGSLQSMGSQRVRHD